MYIYPEIEKNPLLHLCLTEPLRLGKSEIIRENRHGMLTYCPPGRFHCLAADSIGAAEELLAGVENPHFIMLLNEEFAPLLDRFHLDSQMRCRQAAWLKDEPPIPDPRLRIEAPDDRAFARILDTYRMDTPDELRSRRAEGEIFFARDDGDRDAGFVGLHSEGCFGLLEVFPDQRGKGYGAALEKHIIRFCMERGRIPYCQVNELNADSMRLQRKLGLAITEETIFMAWRNE